jgi:hypothetical protein
MAGVVWTDSIFGRGRTSSDGEKRWVAVASVAFVVIVLLASLVNAIGGPDDEDASPTVDSDQDLGMSFDIPATDAHPGLTVGVNELVRTKPGTKGVRVEKRHHLVALRLAIRNTGKTVWRGSTAGAVFIDDAERAYNVDGRFTAVRAGKVWPANFQIRAGGSQTAWVVFAVPNDAEPLRFQFTVGSGATDTATWRLVPTNG